MKLTNKTTSSVAILDQSGRTWTVALALSRLSAPASALSFGNFTKPSHEQQSTSRRRGLGTSTRLFPVNVARAMAHSTCIECARPSFLAICKECQQYEHCAPGEPFWQRLVPHETVGSTVQQERPVRYVRRIRSGRRGHPDHCHRVRYVPKLGKRERHEAKSGHISETTDEPLRREDQSARVGRSSCSISICGGSSSAGISSSSSSCCISSNGGWFQWHQWQKQQQQQWEHQQPPHASGSRGSASGQQWQQQQQ